MAVRITRELVTPEKAQGWLDTLSEAAERGFPQRRRKDGHMAMLSREMKAGRTRDTAESIKFHKDGFLVDGMHRLSAQVMADVTLTWLVARGLDDDAVRVLDTGVVRTVRDVFTMRGRTNAHRLCAAIRTLHYLAGGNWNEKISHEEYEQIFQSHPTIPESVALAHKIPSAVAPSTAFAAIHYIGANYQDSKDLADGYLSIMATGSLPNGNYPKQGNAATAVRERAIKGQRAFAKLLPRQWVGLAVHGWNLYRKDETKQVIKLPDNPEVPGWDMDCCLFGAPSVPVTKKK
jgi:hypothetical protein